MDIRFRIRPFDEHRLIGKRFEFGAVGGSRFHAVRGEQAPAGAQFLVPLAFPLSLFRVEFRHWRFEFSLAILDVLLKPVLPLRLFARRQLKEWVRIRFVSIHHRLIKVIKHRV